MKYDTGKPLMALLPPKATLEVARILTYGANKYSIDNWKTTSDSDVRYLSAVLRHIFQHLEGEELDEETGMSHLAHAICSLLFILENRLANEKKGARKSK